MNIYVIYDTKSGEIVHTTACYKLGEDDPIPMREQDALDIGTAHVDGARSLAVTRVPDGFDLSDRSVVLDVDPATGVCTTLPLNEARKRRAAKPAGRSSGPARIAPAGNAKEKSKAPKKSAAKKRKK